LRPCFRPLYKGRDIFRIPVTKSGASFGAPLEWIYAAKFNGFNTMEFLRESLDDQVFMIAAYRVDAQLKAVIEEERAEEMRRKQNGG
jgi:hypothetical protein